MSIGVGAESVDACTRVSIHRHVRTCRGKRCEARHPRRNIREVWFGFGFGLVRATVVCIGRVRIPRSTSYLSAFPPCAAQITNGFSVRDVEMDSWSCLQGWPAQGLGSGGSVGGEGDPGGGEVLAVCRSNEEGVMAVRMNPCTSWTHTQHIQFREMVVAAEGDREFGPISELQVPGNLRICFIFASSRVGTVRWRVVRVNQHAYVYIHTC